MIIVILLYIAILVVVVAGMWKMFEKAGQPGWACIVPFYNIYILTVIAGKPSWWLVLFIIPIANIIAAFVIFMEIARRFGKSEGFGVGMVFLGFIFIPILGFGDAVYQGTPNSDPDLLDDI